MTEDDLTKQQTGRLVRLAVAYDGRDLKDIAKEAKIPVGTLRNYLGPARLSRARLEQRRKIAKACKVPVWFMEGGFANAPRQHDDQQETLRRLVAQARATEGRLLLLEAVARRQIDASSGSSGDLPQQEPPP